jgi:hypothetical protein
VEKLFGAEAIYWMAPRGPGAPLDARRDCVIASVVLMDNADFAAKMKPCQKS